MVGAIAEVTQDPTKAGNALKTISMRIRGMKKELEEAGETAEGVGSITDMQAKIMKLTRGKVNIFGDDGEFKSTYDILNEVAAIYDDLTSKERADLLETMAGKNRANDLAAYFSNWETGIKMAEAAENSYGSAAEENARYVDSLQGRLNALTASFQALSASILDSGFLKGIVSGATVVLDVLNKITSTLGIIPTLIAGISTAAAMMGKGFIKIDPNKSGGFTSRVELFGKSLKELGRLGKEFRANKNAIGADGSKNGIINGIFDTMTSHIDDKDNIFKNLKKQREIDIKDYAEYQRELESGTSKQNALKKISNDALREEIQNTKDANFELGKYHETQEDATILNIANNGSIKKKTQLLKEMNTGCKNTTKGAKGLMMTLSKDAKAQKGSLFKYLNGLGGNFAGANIKGLLGAGLKTAAKGLIGGVLSGIAGGLVGMVAMKGVEWIGNAISDFIHREEIRSEKVDEVTTKYKDQKKTLEENKKTIDSIGSRYEELSNGVNLRTNENIGLSTDEYEEYLSITGKIAEMFPSMVKGYDAQGNAILNAAGSVEKLNEAYKEQVKDNNNEILSNSEDVFKDYKTEKKNLKLKKHQYDAIKDMLDATDGSDFDSRINDVLANAGKLNEIRSALSAAGISQGVFETSEDYLKRAFKDNTAQVQKALTEYDAKIGEVVQQMQDIAEAHISNAFIDGTYKNISEKSQEIISRLIPNFDDDYYSSFDSDVDMFASIDKMLSAFNNLDSGKKAAFEASFDLETKLNGGDINVGEYLSKLDDVSGIIDAMDIDDASKKALKLSMQLDDNDIKNQYDNIKKQLIDKGIDKKDAKKFLDGLSSYDLKAAIKLLPELDDSNFSLSEFTKRMQEEAEYLAATSFNLDVTDELAGISNLNKAISESNAATGLTVESIDALKNRYSDLDGFNPAALFEKTTTGVRLNTDALKSLENQYITTNKAANEQKIVALGEKYKRLGEEIEKASAAGDTAKVDSLEQQRSAIEESIEEAQMAKAAYDGMTSAYNEWVNAQSAGQEGDMYNSIMSGAENAKKLAQAGKWGNTELQNFIKMFSTEGSLDTATPQQFADAWGSAIGKFNRYITESTQGIDNFFADASKVSDELVYMDENGSWQIKPGVEIEDFAREMGIAESTVEAVFGNANEYGADIKIGVDEKSIDDLIAESEAAAKEASDALKQYMGEDFEIKFDANSDDLDGEIEKLKQQRDEINNSDATVEVKEQGVEAVNAAIETAINKKIELEQPAFMQLDASQVKSTMTEALAALQQYQTAVDEVKRLEALQANGIEIDTAQLDTAKANVDEFATAISQLPEEVKVGIGLEASDGADAVKQKISEGKVTLSVDTDVDKTATEELKSNLEKIEDKDVTITVTVNGLEEAKELAKSVDIATKVDGNVEDLGKFAEAAKQLSSIKDNTTVRLNAYLDSNLHGSDKEAQLENLSPFADAINKLKTVSGNVEVRLKAYMDSDIWGEDKESQLDNLDEFAVAVEKLKGLDGETDVRLNAYLDSDIWGDKEAQLENLPKFADVFDQLKGKDGTTEIRLNAYLDSDIWGDKEAQLNNLPKFVDVFDKLRGKDGTTQIHLQAYLDSDVWGDKATQLNNLPKYAEVAQSLQGVSSKRVDIQAYLDSDVWGDKATQLNNLPKYAEVAQSLQGVSDVNVTMSAKIDNVADYDSINRIASFANAAQQLKDVSNVNVVVSTTADIAAINNIKSTLQGLSDSGVMKGYSASVTVTASNTDLGNDFTGTGKVDMSAKTKNMGKDFTGSGTVKMKPKTKNLGNGFYGTGTVTITKNYVDGSGSSSSSKKKKGKVNGTAHVDGTAFSRGNWSTKDSGTALMGELGPETIVRDGRYFTVGDNGAEFVKYRKGDIIFNHKQTEELFKNGYVTSDGGRGRAYAEGTAFAGVGGGWTPGGIKPSGGSSGSKSNYNKVSNGNSKSTKQATKDAEEFEEQLDWIEVAIDRIERAINHLDTVASSAFKSWSERTAALNDQMVEVRNEIDLQQRAYERYMQAANEVGLSADWVDKIKNGKIDIELITDESLKNQIDQFKEFYNKALDCKDAIDALNESLGELTQQKFDNIAKQFEGILGSLEYEQGMIENFIDRAEVDGQVVSKKYYEFLKNNVHAQANALREQVKQMIATRDEAVNEGRMAVGDEAWDKMNNEINDITLQIHELGTQWAEFDKAIRETEWKVFDIMQDRISDISSEAEFLIELMSNEKLFEDNGQLTDKGMATMGLHGVNYNTYMGQADMYAEEIKKLKAEMEADPLNMDIADRYYELVEAQREAILSAEESKNAIKDLVEEGIQLELDSLTELIDKYKESLQTQKDLYNYQKKVEEQTKNIADLEKQLSALANDSSEENKAKLQKLKVELESAKDDLEETEYDKFIDDQERLLDEMFDSYSEILNSRLDNIDQLVADMIVEINANSGMISEVISSEANNVGYTVSDQMEQIWSNENAVLTYYGDGFLNSMTNVANVLNGIRTDIQNMVGKIDSIAQDKINGAQNSNASNIPVTKPPAPEKPNPPTQQPEPPKQITVGGKINAGNARIYATAYGEGGGTQTFRNDPIYTVLGERNGYLMVRHHSLKSGITGWFKKSDVKAYAIGKRKVSDDEYAWTQEEGSEMIMRPSDGAILTPLAKNDSVLTAAASKNIWDMANSPVDFIRGNLGIDGSTPATANNQQVSYTQNLDKVVFNLPNVQNYNELLASMQKDKNFERLISSMTIDKIAGKSSLAKGKAIR